MEATVLSTLSLLLFVCRVFWVMEFSPQRHRDGAGRISLICSPPLLESFLFLSISRQTGPVYSCLFLFGSSPSSVPTTTNALPEVWEQRATTKVSFLDMAHH